MKYLLLFLSLLAAMAHAEDASDSDLVHGLAHGGAGAMVAMAADVGPMNIVRYDLSRSHQRLAWYVPILIESCLALAADEFYEAETEKVPTVLAQHNLDATAGAALYAMRVDIEF
jgi:hypothetical protein